MNTTPTTNTRRSTLNLLHALTDLGELELTDEQAAKIMGLDIKDLHQLDSHGESPRNSDGSILLGEVSWWVEQQSR